MAKTRKTKKPTGKENKNPISNRNCGEKEFIETKRKKQTKQTKQKKHMNIIQAPQITIKKREYPKTKSLRISLQRLSKEEIIRLTSEVEKPLKKEYNLRQRNPVECDKIKVKKSNTCIAKKDQLVSINTLFNRCKKDSTKQIQINQIVLAKMATYSPWPAKVIEIINNKAKVFFFGTNQHGQVKLNDCVAVEKCGLLISRLVTSKQANYNKAVKEMEICVGLTGNSRKRFVLIAS